MGLADYLIRHSKNSPPPPSEVDTNFIINLINDFKFGFTKNSIEHTSANRTSTDKYQPIKDATNNYSQARKYNNAFCLNSRNLQLPSVTDNSFHLQHNSKFIKKSEHYQNHTNSLSSNLINSSNTFIKYSNSSNSSIFKHLSNPRISINTIIPQGYVNLTTRNRPRHNTFDQTIQKRKRSQNKSKITMSANNNTQTIATRTEDCSNKGRGRSPLRPDPTNPIFPLSKEKDMPQYRKNLAQLFGEEIVAEATARDKTMGPMIKRIKDRDWETLKKTGPYFYSLKRDLSVTPSGCVLYDNRLMIPSLLLKQLIIDALHQTHPGQTGMLRLTDLIWFPRIHRDGATKAQS